MLLAELEIWHTRPTVPTRRLALGHMVLPVDPAPGFGGLLLGSVVAAHLAGVDDDLIPDVHRLIGEIEHGARVVQPRLRHRFQIDRHGLAHSRHRLVGDGDEISFDFASVGTDLAQVLGAIYATERLDAEHRLSIVPLLHEAARWRGPIGPTLIAHLAGSRIETLGALADPLGWALDLLGFDPTAKPPPKRQVTARFRERIRDVHPDHGGDEVDAAKQMSDLAEARRILSVKVRS
ncbi:MAG: J domain-containing protein [Acidimicrobiia bacterium]|nr:J domain-containing protein [Acidimicrobiia bacterium]